MSFSTSTPTSSPRSLRPPESPIPPTPSSPFSSYRGNHLSVFPRTPPRTPTRAPTTILEIPDQNTEPSIFDYVWSKTSKESYIRPHHMFRLLKNLEIELFAEGNDECVDRHLLTKDIVIKHRILDGLRGQDRISKAQAFDILVESLHDIRFMDGDNKRIIANFGSGVGRVSKDHYRGTLDKDKRRSHFDEESLDDYDETASLMEQQQVSPAYSEDVMLDASTPLKSHKPMSSNSSFASSSEPIFQIRQSIHELEKFHLKLDSQYAFLETEISQLKVKNNVDLHDLKVLMNNNNSMLERIDSIRENLVEVSGLVCQNVENFDPVIDFSGPIQDSAMNPGDYTLYTRGICSGSMDVKAPVEQENTSTRKNFKESDIYDNQIRNSLEQESQGLDAPISLKSGGIAARIETLKQQDTEINLQFQEDDPGVTTLNPEILTDTCKLEQPYEFVGAETEKIENPGRSDKSQGEWKRLAENFPVKSNKEIYDLEEAEVTTIDQIFPPNETIGERATVEQDVEETRGSTEKFDKPVLHECKSVKGSSEERIHESRDKLAKSQPSGNGEEKEDSQIDSERCTTGQEEHGQSTTSFAHLLDATIWKLSNIQDGDRKLEEKHVEKSTENRKEATKRDSTAQYLVSTTKENVEIDRAIERTNISTVFFITSLVLLIAYVIARQC
ncbi:uncharacterized protein J8A68_000148 [[Candida] subhashii]|uniref:Uncharacterized protein n=1 Tax=[Candida] subhashii TaxID=561895 RepID=A0A8J5QTT7_9ASCO|nr:uncharacterized protein J8A68_000148 [[Candida] subhashii]KAG7666311.1 hypothetical protein J8A68_000148 [[Candida] subhashii]